MHATWLACLTKPRTMAWEQDPKYKGKSKKWIGTGEDAGKRPRYQQSQPGTGRRRKAPADAGAKPAGKARQPRQARRVGDIADLPQQPAQQPSQNKLLRLQALDKRAAAEKKAVQTLKPVEDLIDRGLAAGQEIGADSPVARAVEQLDDVALDLLGRRFDVRVPEGADEGTRKKAVQKIIKAIAFVGRAMRRRVR